MKNEYVSFRNAEGKRPLETQVLLEMNGVTDFIGTV
jgi:hypothetical protein